MSSQAKEIVAEVLNDPDDKNPSMNTRMGASLIAGFTAAGFSLPFDLIKSRLQDGSKYKGVVDCAGQILRKVMSHVGHVCVRVPKVRILSTDRS